MSTLLVWTLISLIIIIYFTFFGYRHKWRLREIPGIKAIEDAVGRATEQGKPIVYTTGWGGDILRPTTIASLNMLKFVAGKAAEFNCRLIFPTHDPIIAETAKEIVRNAYLQAGASDSFRDDDIRFVSPSQFGYAAAVDGIVTREKPGAMFLMGTFEGEALILAETGNISGALQISGTDSTIQLSFFIIACDYTLIGEELFIASAYLTDDPKVKASMAAQDLIRLLLLITLLVAVALALAGSQVLEKLL